MAQNILQLFFEYDLSKTPGFIYVLANFLGVIIYTSFNPRRRKGYMELCGTDYSGADVSDLEFFF